MGTSHTRVYHHQHALWLTQHFLHLTARRLAQTCRRVGLAVRRPADLPAVRAAVRRQPGLSEWGYLLVVRGLVRWLASLPRCHWAQLADRFSRRGALVARGPCCRRRAFALWMMVPKLRRFCGWIRPLGDQRLPGLGRLRGPAVRRPDGVRRAVGIRSGLRPGEGRGTGGPTANGPGPRRCCTGSADTSLAGLGQCWALPCLAARAGNAPPGGRRFRRIRRLISADDQDDDEPPEGFVAVLLTGLTEIARQPGPAPEWCCSSRCSMPSTGWRNNFPLLGGRVGRAHRGDSGLRCWGSRSQAAVGALGAGRVTRLGPAALTLVLGLATVALGAAAYLGRPGALVAVAVFYWALSGRVGDQPGRDCRTGSPGPRGPP